jgi:hypothetical protein
VMASGCARSAVFVSVILAPVRARYGLTAGLSMAPPWTPHFSRIVL